MKSLVKRLKPVWSSNLSIIAASFNAAFFVKDAMEYTKNVTRYLHYILFAIFVAVVLLVIRYFHKDSKETDIHIGDNNGDAKNVNSQELENTDGINVFNHPIWKAAIGLVISSVVLVFISGIILYKSQVYYVVLRNNVQTEKEADNFVRMANQTIEQKGLKNLKAFRLYKGRQSDQYLVTINGGYLIQSEAENVKNLLIKNGIKTSSNPEVRPSGAAFLRKLVYLNQLFSNE